MTDGERHRIKKQFLKPVYFFFFIAIRLAAFCCPHIIRDERKVFASFAVLSFHETICGVAAICLVCKKCIMNVVRHDYFAANTAGKINELPLLCVQFLSNAIHLDGISGNHIARSSIATGNSADKNSFLILKFKACAIKFIFHKVFAILMLCRPRHELFRVRGFFLAAHRHNVYSFCKVTAVRTHFVQDFICRIKCF